MVFKGNIKLEKDKKDNKSGRGKIKRSVKIVSVQSLWLLQWNQAPVYLELPDLGDSEIGPKQQGHETRAIAEATLTKPAPSLLRQLTLPRALGPESQQVSMKWLMGVSQLRREWPPSLALSSKDRVSCPLKAASLPPELSQAARHPEFRVTALSFPLAAPKSLWDLSTGCPWLIIWESFLLTLQDPLCPSLWFRFWSLLQQNRFSTEGRGERFREHKSDVSVIIQKCVCFLANREWGCLFWKRPMHLVSSHGFLSMLFIHGGNPVLDPPGVLEQGLVMGDAEPLGWVCMCFCWTVVSVRGKL